MKIAYLSEIDPISHLGVLRKIEGQIATWRDMGCEAWGFSISPRPVDQNHSDYIRFFNRFASSGNAYLRYANRWLTFPEVFKAVMEFSPDLIYYRQNVYIPGLSKLLRSHPSVMELNAKDTGEFQSKGALFRKLYDYLRKHQFADCRAFVAVSHEIAKSISRTDKPIAVVSNGVRISQGNGPEVRSNPRGTNIVFVGSPRQAWHGVDRLIELAGLLPEYLFHIIGPEQQGHSRKNVRWYGFLNPEQLQSVYQTMDYSVGTLCWARSSMSEGSPLKVREYMNNNLPCIAGYQDTDLSGDSAFFQLPDQSDALNINLQDLNSFLHEWQFRNIGQSTLDKIDWRAKESVRLAFLSNIANTGIQQ